jgi:2-phosphoglycerate kinase
MIERIIAEGTTGVVEGVHILPGEIQGLSPGVVELLINPNDATHQAMFTNKHAAGKLRTVSEDLETRNKEYEGTRAIQNYMLKLAQEANVPVVEMNSFEESTISISKMIVKSVRKLVVEFEGASKQ